METYPDIGLAWTLDNILAGSQAITRHRINLWPNWRHISNRRWSLLETISLSPDVSWEYVLAGPHTRLSTGETRHPEILFALVMSHVISTNLIRRPFVRFICEPVPSQLQDTFRQEPKTPHVTCSRPDLPTTPSIRKETCHGGIGAPLKHCASWEPSTDFASIFTEVPPHLR
jgi:hypothetical protein